MSFFLCASKPTLVFSTIEIVLNFLCGDGLFILIQDLVILPDLERASFIECLDLDRKSIRQTR